MSPFHVVVANGGLAGPTLANHLDRHGVAVTVVERDTTVASRGPGYRIHVNSSGATALRSSSGDQATTSRARRRRRRGAYEDAGRSPTVDTL